MPQAKFAFSFMVNYSTGKSPFEIVYTKVPSHTTNLLQLPRSQSNAADGLATCIAHTLAKVRAKLQQSNFKYKTAANMHRHAKLFNVGDLVMVHLNKQQTPVSENSKLMTRKSSPFHVHSKINDNAYHIEIPFS